MSWLFGYGKPTPSDPAVQVSGAPSPPVPPPTKKEHKSDETGASYRFDSAALERAAKAARELESSKHAKEAFELSQKHEQTLQMEYQSKMKEYELGMEQIKIQQYRAQQEERRKTMEEEAKIQKQRADYQDMLARKRQEDQLALQARMQDESLRKQEESIKKQESMRRSTIEFEAELRHKNEMKQIEAKIRGEAQVERENRELRLERARLEAKEYRQTILESISTAGSVLGSGLNAFISERDKVATVIGSLTLLAGGIYGAKYGIGTVARLAEARIGKPSLVRDTSRLNIVDTIRHPILTSKRLFARPMDPLSGIILNSLAKHSGMDYAILTGGDIAPMGNEGVTAVHKVFDWANTSKKGVLLFVDEADAFLRKREQERISEGLRATLNAFLFRTGEQSKKFMLVLASNQPEQFDWAINDRMDEIVQFDLPGLAERERLVRHYFDLYLLQPSLDKRQRIRLADDIDYTAECEEVARRTEGLSGREISKVAVAWQTAAYASEDGILTKAMMESVVNSAIAANRKKREWRHHKLPAPGDAIDIAPS
ncbi:hypothetical protein AHF37_00515 [Paragonimus kellicotti]|nr:hypothetical protein AHF37_00515 [Paragonimus kellicotti]